MRRSFTVGSLVVLTSALALVAAACGGSGGGTTSFAVSTSAQPTGGLALPVSSVRFAEYAPVPLVGPDTPAYAGPATPHSLAGVQTVAAVRTALAKPGVSKALAAQGFVVVPADFGLFHQAYQGNDYEGWPVFVTADAAYNAWHLVFDKLLRSVEQGVLLPKLEQLVAGLLKDAHAQTKELAKTPLAEDASRVEQLFQVAAAVLGKPVTLGPLAAREKALIDAHTAPSEVSPITGATVDYSLFTPRGHYTLNADLTRFFLGMSVLGQLQFCLPGTQSCPGLEPARLGLLASRVLEEDGPIQQLWHDVYDPTSFLVGLADDYTPLEVAAAAAKATPNGLYDAKALADDATVRAIVRALTSARPVLINPEKASIRIMGTRFVIDSYLLDQLVYPNVGTEAKPRLFPSALDLASAFGSHVAEQTLAKTGGSAYANYGTQLAKVRAVVANRPAEDWGSTVYDAWLAALEPMFVAHGRAFPDFMRSDAWAAKDLQSGFGSYTELKHDTVLFTKQVVAEGGGPTPPPPPRNWVEPDPAAFGRLAAAADLLEQGLLQRSLLTPEQAGLLSTEIDLFRFLERVARDELAGTAISKADDNRLRYVGGELEAIWWRSSARNGAVPTDPDAAAVVADIASSSKGVLELGTGRIDRIYVLVPGAAGKFEVAVGGVYSYYEFTNPPGQRLTDAEWHAMLDRKPPPARPTWEGQFTAG